MSYAEMKDNSRLHSIYFEHGGVVYEAARRSGIEPHEVLDFSANINPLGPTQTVLSAIENALTATSLRVRRGLRGRVWLLLSPDTRGIGSFDHLIPHPRREHAAIQ